MNTYLVKVVKVGLEQVEAKDEKEAREVAIAMEAEGAFFMEMEVEVVEQVQ